MTTLNVPITGNLHDAWDEVAAELCEIPLLLEVVRYGAAIKPLTVLPKTAQILEAGCGAGRILRSLSALGYENLSGLEISHARLRYINRHGPSNARLVCTDKVPFADASFDAVVSAAVIEHVADPAPWLAELARVTRPGGLISLTSDTYMWRWLQLLGLYKTVQPLDRAIWPTTLIGWGRRAGLELVACGGFVNVPEQEWFFPKQLKRLTSLRRWYCKLRKIRGTPRPQPPVRHIPEVEGVLEAVDQFPMTDARDVLAAIFSYESFFWFRKPAR